MAVKSSHAPERTELAELCAACSLGVYSVLLGSIFRDWTGLEKGVAEVGLPPRHLSSCRPALEGGCSRAGAVNRL
jgi:hypothetical protein